ncbi:MAG TPA: tungstate transporter permease [Bacteroidales bacterium]|nr:tungstate transporter permease [Bacteroidales bacterium]
MELFFEGLLQAIRLLLEGNREVLEITLLSLKVSGLATLLSVIIGVPLGVVLALSRFWGRNAAVGVINTGMGLPPTVVGLVVSIFLWRSGPLGFLGLMYTPTAIIIAQALIAFPLVTGFTMAGVQQLNSNLRLQIIAMGASRLQLWWLLLRESRLSLLAAVIAGFGGVLSEVGAVMMVGGNIRGQTRVLTTAIVMEVSRGQFALAIALSIILLALAFAITMSLTKIQQRGRSK